MPHFTTLFSRPSQEFPSDFKKNSNRRRSSGRFSRPAFSERDPSSSGSSLVSQDGSVKMPENPLKRLSKNILHTNPKHSAPSLAYQPATVELEVESPPLVLYGSENSSDGALVGGTIKITVNDDAWSFTSFKMSLNKEITRRKPFHQGCQDCAHDKSSVQDWNFVSAPVTTLARGVHTYPFSYLFPGNSLPTTHGSLQNLEYWLRLKVTPEQADHAPLTFAHQLQLKRAVFPSDNLRHSIRIFPPTNIKADCHFPSVIHPIGEHTFSLRLDGVISRNSDTRIQTHWKMRRLAWRLEERSKTISPPCPKHAPKGQAQAKNSERDDAKIVGMGNATAWKADYTNAAGCIEVEFPFGANTGDKVTCNMKDGQGTAITHVLEVEMIVYEEYAPLKKLSQTTPTGGARVLRMHFDMNLTERAGLGVSWTMERPPLYGDVPPSPPTYKFADAESCPEYEALDLVETSGVRDPQARGERTSVSPPPVGVRRRLSISDLEQDDMTPEISREEQEVSTPTEEIESGNIYDD